MADNPKRCNACGVTHISGRQCPSPAYPLRPWWEPAAPAPVVDPTPRGWICARCGRSNAPHVDHCTGC